MPPKIIRTIDVNAIPLELRDLPRWACWQERPSKDGKKPGKPPIQANVPFTGRHVFARTNDPQTWAPFNTALRYWQNHLRGEAPPSGLSFALNEDGIVGIDLDGCRNVTTKGIADWAVEIIRLFASYTEISPSGTGIRIFIRGGLPCGGQHKGQIEVYGSGKFLTVTGRQLKGFGAGDRIEDRPAELVAWHWEVFGAAPPQKEKKDSGQLAINDLPELDPGRLDRLFRAKPKAKALFDGMSGGKPSQSEADMALANYATAAGWTAQQTCDLLVAARRNAGAEIKPPDYFERTVAKARDGDAENRNSEKGGGVTAGPSTAGAITIEEAREVFSRHLYLPDPNVVDVVLSVPAGNRLLDTDPLWLFLKGPPGSGKTELLNSLRELSEWAVFVSSLTPAAIISGYVDPNGPDPSLLPQLDGKCLVIKDFTTILAMNPMQRDEIYGILRDAYDGHAAKNFGTGRREYTSRFNLLSGVTSAIEKAWHLTALGERFLAWTMKTDHKEQTRRAMGNVNNEPTIRRELARAAAGVLAGLPGVIPEVPETLQEKVQTLAYLLARLRTYVARDRNDVVHTAPEVEVPTRIVKQLLRLGQSVALVRHRSSLTDDEFAVMRKVALDSVPSARAAIFGELVAAKKKQQQCDVNYYANRCRISFSPAKRHLDDMKLLGLVEAEVRDRKSYFKLSAEAWSDWSSIQ